ncbi:hypothetical protein ZOSMA_5G02130 [Zostera marina]|uniref:Uncharacterized protein n=1 Tax=Zostera marina TaxID=29655 RepID=A0A0K9NU73_ZOSMR|nr:hypothetical protein ZOSMA_5G02130 [Zostera marina]
MILESNLCGYALRGLRRMSSEDALGKAYVHSRTEE